MEDMTADGYSYQTQNFSGFWGITLPWGWTLFQTLSSLGSLRSFGVIRSLGILAANLGSDLVVYLQTISWNGLLTEISHIVSQRPRPFVFSNPTERGIDPAHYTSFYSGHTSFAAATGTCGFLLLMRAGAPLALLLLSFASTQALILSTAYFRILAGRHFLTDVLCGAIAGSITAYCLARRKAKKPIQKNTHGSKREAKLLTY
jgi:undecaprenyl-diphosphatase